MFYVLNFCWLCYIFSSNKLQLFGVRGPEADEKNYRVAECVKSHMFSVLFCFISTSLKKFHSNFSNLTPSFSLSLWSLLAVSVENWNLNFIVSLSMRIFSISEEKVWGTKFWVYLKSPSLKGPVSLLKQTIWWTFKKKT